MTPVTALNDEQRRAAAALNGGNVLVVAGPGAGKTHTLTAALAAVRQQAPAARWLCLTFTTKAADNIRERLGPAPAAGSFVGTFHALAARLLHGGTGDEIRIIGPDDTLQILRALQRRYPAAGNLRELSLLISRCKNGSLNAPAPGLQRLVEAYDAALAERGLIDYDDLILRCTERGESLPAYDYLFVDEFQDTSPRQYELLQQLAAAGGRGGRAVRLFAIGDPKQSIYRFRGADGSVFQRLADDFRPEVVELRHNHRSAASIVAAANRIFPEQAPQQARRRQAGQQASVETLDEYSEADYILRTVEQALGGTEWHRTHHDQARLEAAHFRDFAVLYRTRRQGELLARKLRAAGLPLQCLGEDSPYASRPVQLLLTALETLEPGSPPAEAIREIAEAWGIAGEDSVLQVENLASRFGGLEAFLAYMAALSEQAFFDPRADAVILSTIHASKGLEFRHVFVTGCEAGLLPIRQATGDEALAEEQRLFYVALTRARDSLTLLHARRRGQRPTRPSPFLALAGLPARLDEGLAATEQQRRRNRQKRAQQRLF